MAKTKYILLNTVGSGTWTVPSDWNNTNNRIVLIGGGGGASGINWIGGAGGGCYYIDNFQTTAGTSYPYTVGAAGADADGGNTTFNTSNIAYGGYSGLNSGVGRSGTGSGGVATTGGSGASAAQSSAGGGAAGIYGNGVSSVSSQGGAGDAGLGGAGGLVAVNGNGYPGLEIYPGVAGSGGGGSNGGGTALGGLYGGGGGVNQSGAQGVIIIQYTPAAYFNSPDGDLEDIFVKDYDMIDQYAMTGSLWNWGNGTSGQLGDNTTVNKSSPVQTISGGTNWKQVSSGSAHNAGIKTDGTLWTWGNNGQRQLGDNTATNRSSPVQTIAAGTNWKLIKCGTYHTAAIKTDGTLWTWGSDQYGQLGDNTVSNKSSPVQTIAAGTNWNRVACNLAHTAAIKTDGTLWTWGRNIFGQLGDNTTTNKSSPVQTIAAGTNWKQVSCGFYHTAAIKTDGTLWMWGANLGDNTTTNKSSPVQTISGGTNWKQVACGGTHTAAIKTDGTLWLWGGNSAGELGDNTNTSKSSPVQTIAAGTNWKQVACGYGNTVAVKTDGTLWTWGDNGIGQLGTNSTIKRSSPVQTVSGGTNWKQVDCGSPGASYSLNGITAIYYYDAGNLYPK